MFTANTALHAWTGAATTFNAEFHELANTLLVEGLEWVGSDDLLVDVGVDDFVHVVA